jgi:SAM-dependent methyltransferase
VTVGGSNIPERGSFQPQEGMGHLRLDLGCGQRKREGFIGVDCIPAPGVDVVADLEARLPFEDNSAIEVHCHSVIEHLSEPIQFLDDVHRILHPSGTLRVYVPHFSNPYGHSDPTHRHLYGLYSFQYLTPQERQHFRRKVPDHYTSAHWEVLSERLIFLGETRIGMVLGRAFGKLVNSHTRIQAFYERLLCWQIPCYALSVELRPMKDTTEPSSARRAPTKEVAPDRKAHS